MQTSAAFTDSSHAWPLPAGLRLVVEVDAQGMRISFVPTAATPNACVALESDSVASPAESVDEGGTSETRPRQPETGLGVARRIAEERGEGALLKFEEWDELLPRSVVRREIKRALDARRLPFMPKGKGRDGRARMISARDMVLFFADGADER